MGYPQTRRRLVLSAILVTLATTATPQPGGGESEQLLNSARIALEFGSYGVEILEAGEDTRVSALYSDERGIRTVRTFAVVRFHADARRNLADEHRLVLAGGSIGETLVSRGWTVLKSDRYFGVMPSTERLESLMKLGSARMLAVHVYDLLAQRSAQTFEYGTIAEIHHPEYLTLAELHEIYGPIEAIGAPEAMLVLAWQKMN